MKMDKNLQTVFEMMLDRCAKLNESAFFAIPVEIASPDTVTDEEAAALEAAGFVWTVREDNGYEGYMLALTVEEEDLHE
jgi:hypothetical protein